MSTLESRLARLYRRIDASRDGDLRKFPFKSFETPAGPGFINDFSGGMTQHDMLDESYWLLHQVAHLRNDLFKWIGNDEIRKTLIVDAIDASLEIRLCIDLANNDRHGGPRGTGHSGRSPRLVHVRRTLRITGGGPEAAQGFTLAWDLQTGQLKTRELGGADVIIEGEVVDASGTRIAYFHDVTTKAIADWEQLLRSLGESDRRDEPGRTSTN